MNIDWTWFLLGIAFSMFVLPFITAMIGRRRGTASTA